MLHFAAGKFSDGAKSGTGGMVSPEIKFSKFANAKTNWNMPMQMKNSLNDTLV